MRDATLIDTTEDEARLAPDERPRATITPSLRPLRPYQRDVGRAVMRSVLGRLGRTITVEIARQGGKNELSAQLELFLLTMSADQGVDLVKCAPTFNPQLIVSMRRLNDRMTDAGMARVFRLRGHAGELCRARALFLSADPSANVVGHTAGLLLEVDEAQDVDPDKFDREFAPMGATTNVTTVMYGTPWRSDSLLERAKQANLEAQRNDGEQRHFSFDWREVARIDPDYAAHVEERRSALGETHPTFLTQYCLQLAPGDGRLFDATQRALLYGEHPRQSAPRDGDTYVAGLDLAGGDAPAAPPRAHDATVLTIGRVVFPQPGALVQEPRVEIVEHYAWNGLAHEKMLPQLIALLKRWRIAGIAIDATGLGETVARLVAQALGEQRVDAVKFTAPAKSDLGYDLVAAVNGARLAMYEPDGTTQSVEFWRQVERARVAYRAGTTMNFFVDPADGHDDYITSAALLVRAARERTPRVATGRVREHGW